MQPPWVAPMLATLSTRPPTGDQWAWELKWDGVRAMAHVRDGTVRFSNRTGGDITLGYPELCIPHPPFALEEMLVDGEIVAIDPETGRPSFQLLQTRMHVRDPHRIAELQATAPVQFVAFDLLHLNGVDLVDRTYVQRRDLLLCLEWDGHPGWIAPDHAVGDSDALWNIVEQFELEGVIAKRIDSRYEVGRRSQSWRKVKRTLTQSFVVGGWLPGAGKRLGTLGSLVVGIPGADGRLVPCGSVGSGLRDRDLAEFTRVLERIAAESSPFAAPVDSGARFVQPIIVVDVKFSEWTNTATLRHPVFVAVRPDLDPANVRRTT